MSVGAVIAIVPHSISITQAAPGYWGKEEASGLTSSATPTILAREDEISVHMASDTKFYKDGHSVLLHEFGHLIHMHFLGDDEKQTIASWWMDKKKKGRRGSGWMDHRDIALKMSMNGSLRYFMLGRVAMAGGGQHLLSEFGQITNGWLKMRRN
ncbi:hypothetical protein ACFQ51_55925 [Streptomyces kaempferi]